MRRGPGTAMRSIIKQLKAGDRLAFDYVDGERKYFWISAAALPPQDSVERLIKAGLVKIGEGGMFGLPGYFVELTGAES